VNLTDDNGTQKGRVDPVDGGDEPLVAGEPPDPEGTPLETAIGASRIAASATATTTRIMRTIRFLSGISVKRKLIRREER